MSLVQVPEKGLLIVADAFLSRYSIGPYMSAEFNS